MRGSRGFTLVELLTVMSIASLLMVLVASGIQSAFGKVFDSEVTQLADTLVRARAYAMANNTYVFVGIQEVNAATATGGAQTVGSGRIGVVVVATNDGTRGYLTSMSASATIPTTAGTQLLIVSPLIQFNNLHMIFLNPGTLTGSPSTSNGLFYNLSKNTGLYKQTALTTFTWPVGSAAPQYTFGPNSATNLSSVIQFNPQGEAQIDTGANTDSYYQWIEIDLEPTHGNHVPAASTNNAAILINGPSGNVSIYRT